MKKASLLTLLVLVVSLIYKIHDINMNKDDGNWQTFTKKNESDTKVLHWESTKEELAEAKVENTTAQKRRPSSIPSMAQKVRMIAGREVTGDRNADAKGLKWVNSYNSKWQEKLGNLLLKFQEPDTKVLVKKNKSVIEIKNGKGRLMEHVTISYLLKGDDTTSFNAWVDSETGQMIRTWNKTIKEPVGHHHERLILTPTGTL